MITQIEFELSAAAVSQNDAVLACLTRNVGAWVPMPLLVEVCGGYAVHSRVADLRKLGHNIENLVDRTVKPYRSYYRLL